MVEDDELQIHTELILTSDTFAGRSGFRQKLDATEYEIYLYDGAGVPFGPEGIAGKIVVPAMQTTVLSVHDILGRRAKFWGGMKIRLRPRARVPMHASDLFSSAFLRWNGEASFDNVHANPDPLQWQEPKQFFYSMPYPPESEYRSVFSLFNPNPEDSSGVITLYNSLGLKLSETPYRLKAHNSLIFDLQNRSLVSSANPAFKDALAPREPLQRNGGGGTVGVSNREGSAKSFGYLMIRRRDSQRFSVEHPIHQPPFDPIAATQPFGDAGQFKARNVLYTPLVFSDKRIGGITLQSSLHFSSGAPLEKFLWINPVVTAADGTVVWQFGNSAKAPQSIATQQMDRGIIKLGAMQSCIFDCSRIGLAANFSGAISIAVAPNTNHTLMKVEIKVAEWKAHAFTHCRPGLQSARSYQASPHREGLATDYVTSGAHLRRDGRVLLADEIVALMNIDEQAGRPTLEVFSHEGFVTGIPLGEIPSFGCRHYLLSDLLPRESFARDLSLRLVDEEATMLMSVVHIDHVKKDIAADHGSDRFSTFNDFTCTV